MYEAKHYHKTAEGLIRCGLCPHECLLREGEVGLCRARKHVDGMLVSENYGKLTALHLDPIEKKPLYHYFPGRQILSVGSFGCNFRCGWCQNASISQPGHNQYRSLPVTAPTSVVEKAIDSKSFGIAYTYNEPVVYFEYMLDIAERAFEAGLKNVMVTNAHINPKPLSELLPLLHAVNADLKSFDAGFYKKRAGGNIEAVKKSLITMARRGIHLELTMLVIPGFNDDKEMFKNLTIWVADKLGRRTILHLSRYFPALKVLQPSTPVELLEDFYEIAKMQLPHVYLGNVQGIPKASSTRCQTCGSLVIERLAYRINTLGMDEHGRCMHCKEQICIVK